MSTREVPDLMAAAHDFGRPYGWLERVLGEERRFAHRNEALAWMATRSGQIAKAEGVHVADSADAADFVCRASAVLTGED